MVRTDDNLTKTKEIKNTEMKPNKNYSKSNFVTNDFFMVKPSLKFRISKRSFEKITKHETEMSTVKRKVAEVSPFIQKEPLDLRCEKISKINNYPKSSINHECSESTQREFSKEFEKGLNYKHF